MLIAWARVGQPAEDKGVMAVRMEQHRMGRCKLGINGTLSRLLRRCQVPVTLYSLLAVSFLLLSAQITLASQVTLAWDPSSDPSTSGYKIYYGTSSHNYNTNIDVGNITTYTVTGLSDGQTYYFAVTAHDAQGQESSYSNEVSATFAAACTYSLSSAGQSFDANGGNGTVNIVAGSGCSWTVSNPASWITISSGQTGSGSGTVTYTVSQNASDVDRSSALTIAGSPYTISQDASGAVVNDSCIYLPAVVPPVEGWRRWRWRWRMFYRHRSLRLLHRSPRHGAQVLS